MANNVQVESPWLRPWINETPRDEGDVNKCQTKEWQCMTDAERNDYLSKRANSIIQPTT